MGSGRESLLPALLPWIRDLHVGAQAIHGLTPSAHRRGIAEIIEAANAELSDQGITLCGTSKIHPSFGG
jgi:hypothetical protein